MDASDRFNDMFAWEGRLGRRAYARRLVVVVALFAGLVVLPSLYMATQGDQRCSVPGCGAELAEALVWLALYPLLFAPIGMAAISLGVRRARDAGLPAALGAFPVLVCFGDADNFLVLALGIHGPLFSARSGLSAPLFVLAGLASAVALSLPKSRGGGARTGA
jgi:uncharacterized membrane protein YhaH (DUF805 family)